jgi:hypothetical protein
LPKSYQPGIYVEISGKTQPNGAVLVRQIRLRTIDISGMLNGVRPQGWLIDSANITVPASARITGRIQTGRWVHATIYRQVGLGLVAASITIDPGPFIR